METRIENEPMNEMKYLLDFVSAVSVMIIVDWYKVKRVAIFLTNHIAKIIEYLIF